jgi:hypothetical protein
MNIILFALFALVKSTNYFEKFPPAKLTQLGCNNKINLLVGNTNNINSCERIIKGTGKPNTKISIYSSNYINSYVDSYGIMQTNLGSYQKFSYTNLNTKIDIEVVNNAIKTNHIFNYDNSFFSYDINEFYLIQNAKYVIAVKSNGLIKAFGNDWLDSANAFNQKLPLKQLVTNADYAIGLNTNNTIEFYNPYQVFTGDYYELTRLKEYIDSLGKIKKIYAGGKEQFGILTEQNLLVIFPSKILGSSNFNYNFYQVDPKFILFDYEHNSGCFIDSYGNLRSWNTNFLTKNNFPQIISADIQIDSYGNWEYSLTNDDIQKIINNNSSHLFVESYEFENDDNFNMVIFPNSINIEHYKVIEPKLEIFQTQILNISVWNNYLKIFGKSLPNSTLSIYSIGSIFPNENENFLNNIYLQNSNIYCNTYSCIYSDGETITNVPNHPSINFASIRQFIKSNVKYVYPIYSGGFVILKNTGEMLVIENNNLNSYLYWKNIAQICTSYSSYIALTFDGKILIANSFYSNSNVKFKAIRTSSQSYNFFAGITTANELYFFDLNLNVLSTHQIPNNNEYEIIFSEQSYGIIFNNGTIINLSNNNYYFNEEYLLNFIDLNITTDSNGYFNYLINLTHIDIIKSKYSNYLAIRTNQNMNIGFSKKINFDSIYSKLKPTLNPTLKPTTSPTIKLITNSKKPTVYTT